MSSPVITPNMSLTEPIVGGTTGGTSVIDYGPLVNQNFVILDGHNHAPGSGVQIPPAGLNINTNLPFQGNSITELNSLVFNGAVTGMGQLLSLYTNGTDLFYEDIHGNSIQLTKAGGPNAGTGNIQGLPSTPIGGAGISWVNGTSTFQFLVDAGTVGANIDVGSATLRYPGSYPTPSGSNWITLEVPSSISSGYSITLPVAPPSSISLVQMSSTGVLSASNTVSGNVTITGTATVDSNLIVDGNATIDGEIILGPSAASIIGGADGVQVGALQLGVSPEAVITSDASFRLLVGNNGGTNLKPVVVSNYLNTDSALAQGMLSGTVASNGVVTSGVGFTVSKGITGAYSIIFDENFTTIPCGVAVATSNSNVAVCVEASGTLGGMAIRFVGMPSGSPTDVSFNFIVVGSIN
jgi:hypothetical protein